MSSVICPHCGRKMTESDRARDDAWVEYSCDGCGTKRTELPEPKRDVLKLFRDSA